MSELKLKNAHLMVEGKAREVLPVVVGSFNRVPWQVPGESAYRDKSAARNLWVVRDGDVEVMPHVR